MGDVNAWDIMEGQGRGASVPRRSLSPARTSHIDSEFDAIDLQVDLYISYTVSSFRLLVLAGRKSPKLKENAAGGASRPVGLLPIIFYRSPALDTIRRVSRRVLERMHVIRKREDAFLYLDSELERLPFDDYCKR